MGGNGGGHGNVNTINNDSSQHNLEQDPNRDRDRDRDREREGERESSSAFVFTLARPNTGLDMTPRTDRVRRTRVSEEPDEDLDSRTEQQQQRGPDDFATVVTGTETVTTTVMDADNVMPAVSTPVNPEASEVVSATPISTTSSDAPTSAAATTSAAADTTTEPIEGASTPITTTTTTIPSAAMPLPRPSIAESRTDAILVHRQPTAAERRIQSQMNYLKKFMCVIATMPIIATLAVYNKIELFMWWVIAVPLLGIALALFWRRQLAFKLQRLQAEADASLLNLALSSTYTSSATRVSRPFLHQDEDPPPPPDYQASIITPPAYILAQQPRKVPSYRSLENLFAFAARQGGRILTRGLDEAERSQEQLAQTSSHSQSQSSGSHVCGSGNGHGGDRTLDVESTPELSTVEQNHEQDVHATSSAMTASTSISEQGPTPSPSPSPPQSPNRDTILSIPTIITTSASSTNAFSTDGSSSTIPSTTVIIQTPPPPPSPRMIPEMVELGSGSGSGMKNVTAAAAAAVVVVAEVEMEVEVKVQVTTIEKNSTLTQ
ncbi:hypothetical protein BGZ51_009223 [Haplosporangium sp. Z 767]|nr:hypothetical protein BGZ50_003953 [Haplosporangium sp. Z 11]KAF9189854.1 hypothetical protein BGZ51_009223 [Haplosporangium sp. Z 767]